MKKVVDFVTASHVIDKTQSEVIKASASELGKSLLYLMVNGFLLGKAEVHCELQLSIDA